MFPRMPSRVGFGRRAAVDFVVCFAGGGRIFSVFFFFFFFFERTRFCCKHEAACSLIYLSTSAGARTGCHYLVCLSVRLSVCVPVCVSVSVCVTCVVFTECKSCTRPISTNPLSTEAGEYGLTRGTWVFARRLDVVAVVGLLWI